MTAEPPAESEPATGAGTSDDSSELVTAVARTVSNSTGMYTFATGVAIPVGIVSAIVTVHYLPPGQFGQLALLMVLAGFLTVLYNVGLLHGTFLWTYGSSGEAGDDLEIEGLGRAGVATQRSAMGTGLIMTIIVVSCGTVVCFLFAKPLAGLLLGSPRKANLIGLAAISGGAGSIYRLTCNVFRFERRMFTFAVFTMARPITVLIASTALIVAGYGVWGAVLGTALPTLACAAGCLLGSRRSYAFVFSLKDARQIVIRGSTVVIPVVCLFLLHNGDLYLLAHWVHGSRLGVYRLASRLGAPPSYFASAFIISWSSFERSALVSAIFEARGHLKVRTKVVTYYMLVGFSIVVMFVLFARLFLLVAPASYANAAKVVPLVALGFVAYGAYIILLRTARPERLLFWYSITAVMSALAFLGFGFLLIPAFGVYGAPVALTLGMGVGCTTVLVLNRRKAEPLPIETSRIVAGLLVAVVVAAVALAGARGDELVSTVTTIVCVVVYIPALLLVRAIPPSHVPVILSVLPTRRGDPRPQLSPAELPAGEREVLERLRLGTLHESRSAVDYARLVRALRRTGGIGQPSAIDSRIGIYLASREPESIRDFQLRALIAEGVDGYELHHLDRLAKATRRSRMFTRRRRPDTRRALRARARGLGAEERARVAEVLRAAGADRNGEVGRNGLNGHTPPLALVRAVRVVRNSLGLGTASAADLSLARALWHGDSEELGARERAELRRLKLAAKLTSRFGAHTNGDESTVAAPARDLLDPGREGELLPPTAVDMTIEAAQACEPVS
jgi:O-antigen/teichoic acid export membrane protein